jgi:hypothetical protein
MSFEVDANDKKTGLLRRLPDFVIIGAAKSGTTTLYAYLRQFPTTYVPNQKELEFFSRECNYENGLDWYTSQFAGSIDAQFCGEASPSYTFYPLFGSVSRRMHDAIPDAKLIYIVRKPVERAFSHYYQRVKSARHLARRGIDRFPQWDDEEVELCKMIQEAEAKGGLAAGATFEDVIEHASWLIDAGKYQYQLEQYLRYYVRDQILVLFFEDLVLKPTELLAGLLEFIGVDPSIAESSKECIANTSTEHTRSIARDHIVSSLRSVPGMTALSRVVPRKIRQKMYSVIQKTSYGDSISSKYEPSEMLPETRKRLLAYYNDSNQWLQEYTGRDLSHWSS